MSTQRRSMKQGFTLIELMVVIVIIGILAAIAIPKLFGMTAKAKASELGPAAGTWSKLQTAYVLEKGEVGSFAEISYIPPGGSTKNLTYKTEQDEDGKDIQVATGDEESETANFTYKGTKTGTGVASTALWEAKMKVPLGNGCDNLADGEWKGEHKIATEGGIVPLMTNGKNACGALTPQFEKIGTKAGS